MMRTVTLLAGLFIAFAGTAHAKPGAPVAFELVQSGPIRPGQPVDIVVRLKPATTVDQMEVQFRGSGGLKVLSGQFIARGSSAAGTSIDHPLTVSAAADGRYYLSAVIRTSVPGGSLARVLAVPVVVGNAPRMAQLAVAQVDSQGEPIKSLPAE